MGFDRIGGPGLSRLSTAVSPGGGGGIKSVQSGRISSTGVHTQVIEAIRPQQSILLWKPLLHPDSRICSYARIDSPTTLAIDGISSGHYGGDWSVIEFSSGIKSIQRGVAVRTDNSFASFNVSISPVDTDRSVINLTGSSAGDGAGNSINALISRAEFLSTTNVRFLSSSSFAPNYVAYEIVEFA